MNIAYSVGIILATGTTPTAIVLLTNAHALRRDARERQRQADDRKAAREKEMRDHAARQVQIFDLAMEELDAEDALAEERRRAMRPGGPAIG
jgi:hypothetical protein